MNEIKFRKHYVTNGEVKARVSYSIDNRIDNRKCVTLYAKDWTRNLGKLFQDYQNDTDSLSDYFDEGRVILFEGHPFYSDARNVANSIN